MSIIEQKYIKLCIKIAKLGVGQVSPNPLVGAVIVNNNKIISKAYHAKYGCLHAEAKAIEQVSFEELKGSILYCNLEPCCHTNKNTPPCVPKIIESGIKKVIISNVDPNKFVEGKGVKQLRDCGIEVKLGVCEMEGYELNKFYFKFIKTGLPFITIKIAHSLDLKISSKFGQKTKITGYKSNKFVHYLRSIHDAVLVGANTIKIDNPKLTVRLVKGRNPKRIVIDGNLSSPLNSSVFNDSYKDLTMLFTKSNSDIKKISLLKLNGIKVFELEPDYTGCLKLSEILKILANEKINSLLIEGGGIIFKMFIKENLFDEIIFLESPTIFGDGLPLSINKKSLNIKIIEERMLGNDKKIIYSNAN